MTEAIVSQQPVSQQPTMQELLTRVSGDALVEIRKEVEDIHSQLDASSYWYKLKSSNSGGDSWSAPKKPVASGAYATREEMIKEVKDLRDLIEEEYATRILRGFRNRLKTLSTTLHPPTKVEEVAASGKLIPINALAALDTERRKKLDRIAELQAQLADALADVEGTTVTEEDETPPRG